MSTTSAFAIVGHVGRNVFPKAFRLRTSADFKKVYEGGTKRASRCFVLFALRNGLDRSRFGLTTSRKVGKAHDRNKVKRWVREILRTSLTAIPKGFDFVVNPRRSATDRDFEDLRGELVALLGAEK
ncbi:MAG: ribonuclease P protein component [Acidobacteria bacterium]|nr:MAG: ribonuclease P protein component [Acidobacteriota bacterium]